MAVIALETLTAIKGSSPTLGADFSKFGPVKAGNAISEPGAAMVTAGTGIVVGTAEVITEDFEDFGTGKKIPANKGVKARFDLTAPGVVLGIHNIRLSCVCDGDLLYLIGKLQVVDETGSV